MKSTTIPRSFFRVRAVVARHVHAPVNQVRPQQSLRTELGLNQLDLALIALQLEGQIGVEVPFLAIQRATTVRDLSECIDQLTCPGRPG